MTTTPDMEHLLPPPDSRRTFDDLMQIAHDLGVEVNWKRGNTRGGYHDGLRRIRLNPGGSARVNLCFLAHEIAHALFRDTRSPHGPVNMKQERRAWTWAARYLISAHEYAAAEKLRNGHTPSMAYDLGVTVELVDAFRLTLDRIGTTTYVAPKMGAGQYDLKVEVA